MVHQMKCLSSWMWLFWQIENILFPLNHPMSCCMWSVHINPWSQRSPRRSYRSSTNWILTPLYHSTCKKPLSFQDFGFLGIEDILSSSLQDLFIRITVIFWVLHKVGWLADSSDFLWPPVVSKRISLINPYLNNLCKTRHAQSHFPSTNGKHLCPLLTWLMEPQFPFTDFC